MTVDLRRVIKIAAAGIAAACVIGVFGCAKKKAPADTEFPEVSPGVGTDYVDAEVYYKDGKTSNTVVGIDRLGRTFDAVCGDKADKSRDVGIFYFLSLGQHETDTVVNVSELLKEEDGLERMFLDKDYQFAGNPAYFWAEPIFGYYNSADTWVIRKHLEMLSAAGVDFLVFDVTNAVTYDTVALRIINEVVKLKEAGWDECPTLAFYTASYTHRIIKQLYEDYYKFDKYDSAWYKIDGKPLIIGRIDYADDLLEARGRGDKSYKPEEFSEEIQNYFHFRECQWPSEPFLENGFPWIEWTYPAEVHNGIINVAVASHPCPPMSDSVIFGADNWGRGWNVLTKKNEPEKAAEGQFFQSTWNVALEADPAIVFVTGWNEWVAGRLDHGDTYMMVDLCNTEFSRDAEPMKGGHQDNFYIQLAANIRAYKSVPLGDAKVKADDITIDIGVDDSRWEGAHAVFAAANISDRGRNSSGAGSEIKYKTDAVRNFITEVKIVEDSENYYFRIETLGDVVRRENGETSWMNIFIGTGRIADKGWEGYEYVIGRSEKGNKLSVEKLGSGFSLKKAGEAEFNVIGNATLVKLPKSITGSGTFYFKVADGIENETDISDYYSSGESFPIGALSFRYAG